jgi:4-alpha-glucanotransferase
MNRPGSALGNWRWRVTDDMLSAPALDSLRQLTLASDRAGSVLAATS